MENNNEEYKYLVKYHYFFYMDDMVFLDVFNTVLEKMTEERFQEIKSHLQVGALSIEVLDKACELEKGKFENFEKLEEVILPEGIKEIKADTFRGCSSLKKVTLPSSIEKIGEYAFSWCKSLSDISLPENLKIIGTGSFENCALEVIKLPGSLEKIEDSTFKDCHYLKKVTILEGVKVIESLAFFNCLALNEINLPNSLREIGSKAFKNCCSMEEIEIPKGVTQILRYAFVNCKSLREIRLPNYLGRVADGTFLDCTSLEKVIIPEGVKVIGSSAFENCVALKEFDWPVSLRSVEYGAFSHCCSLKKANLLHVTMLENNLFFDCNNLWSISWPESFNGNIREGYLKRCPNLKELVINYEISEKLIENLQRMYEVNLKDKEEERYFPKSLKKVVICGEKISVDNKIKLRLLLGKLGILKVKFKVDNREKLVDEEIQELTARIDKLIDGLPADLKLEVVKRKKELFNEYFEIQGMERPRLDLEDDSAVNLEQVSFIGDARDKLLIGLNNIIGYLTKQGMLLELLKKINNYDKLFRSNIDCLIECPNTIEDYISNLAFIRRNVDVEMQKRIEGRVETYSNKSKYYYRDGLNSGNSSKKDYEQELLNNLRNFFEKMVVYYEWYAPLRLAFEREVSDNYRYLKDDSIEGLIGDLRYLFSKPVIDDKGLNDKLNLFLNKYKRRIGMIAYKESFKREEYLKLVMDIRMDIQSLLREVKNYSVEEIRRGFEEENVNIGKKDWLCFKEEVIEAVKYLENKQERVAKNNLLIIFIKDIERLLVDNKLDNSERKMVDDKIRELLDKTMEQLREGLSGEDLDIMQKNLYSSLAAIELKVEDYLKQTDQFECVYQRKKVK